MAAATITLRPVAVDPVNETMSTRVFRQQRADAVVAGGDDVDHARREIGVLGDDLPHRAHHGVSGAGLSDGVAAASAGPSLARLI